MVCFPNSAELPHPTTSHRDGIGQYAFPRILPWVLPFTPLIVLSYGRGPWAWQGDFTGTIPSPKNIPRETVTQRGSSPEGAQMVVDDLLTLPLPLGISPLSDHTGPQLVLSFCSFPHRSQSGHSFHFWIGNRLTWYKINRLYIKIFFPPQAVSVTRFFFFNIISRYGSWLCKHFYLSPTLNGNILDTVL